jgi:hypothetical protein
MNIDEATENEKNAAPGVIIMESEYLLEQMIAIETAHMPTDESLPHWHFNLKRDLPLYLVIGILPVLSILTLGLLRITW